MSRFSKKRNQELFDLLEKDNNDDIEFSINDTKNDIKNPYVLTPEEVISSYVEQKKNTEQNSALEALKQKVYSSTVDISSSTSVEEKKKIDTVIKSEPEKNVITKSVFDELIDDTVVKETQQNSSPKKSLFEKCQPYFVDENDKDVSKNPIPTYKLESVADILKSESQKTIESLSKKYDISFDDLGKISNKNSKDSNTITTKTVNKNVENIVADEKPKEIKLTPIYMSEELKRENNVEEEVFEDDIPVTNTVKNVKTSIPKIISDIDKTGINTIFEKSENNVENSATIKFTPITDEKTKSSKISISSQTRQIDMSDELTKIDNDASYDDEEVQLEQNEFEDYVPNDEIKNASDIKKYMRIFSINKRNKFLMTFFSVILTVILGIFKLPSFSEYILENVGVTNIIFTTIFAIIMVLNIDMFKSFKLIFTKKTTADISASLASITVLIYSVVGYLKNQSTLDLILLLGVILSVRSLSLFFKYSSLLLSLKQISANAPKKGIKLIGEPAVTFAMSKGFVEGDALIAAPEKSDLIDDFIKYTSFSRFMKGKYSTFTVITILLSIIIGIATASYFNGMIYGFYSAAVIQCLSAIPTLFFVENLPFYSSSKKLSKSGAMIAGKVGAEHIEMANAIVLNSEDLFPSGTVTLHHMNVLSSNTLDDTIVRAASLTEAMGSTLTNIFKKIAGTGNIKVMPVSDTVKYEDKMGISGWVDNKLLFIGNRTLMETHGISVPDIEVDHKILRSGFFPVYVATEDKACALLVVQYSVKPEIERELKKLTGLGVSLLISNSDPHITEEMICDYFGLYDDLVKIMSNAGTHMYKNTVTPVRHMSAPASYKGNPLGLISILNCASKIKKNNTVFSILYILFYVLGIVLFTYSTFDSSNNLIKGSVVLLYTLATTIISLIIYFTNKP